VFRLYDQTLVRLGRLGHTRELGETPREFAARLRAAGLPGIDAFASLTEHYVAARFGDRDVPVGLLASLEQTLVDLGRAVPDTRPEAA
jgi:hypothetical protein